MSKEFEEKEKRVNDRLNFQLGLILGLIFSLVSSLFIVLLDKIILQNLSTCFLIILFILCFELLLFLLLGLLKPFKSVKKIKKRLSILKPTDDFLTSIEKDKRKN